MSAKFDPEHPTMSMVVVRENDNIRLRPADPDAEQRLNQFAYGTELEIKTYQRRSPGRLKLYWSILAMCVENSDDKYGSSENLHDVVKITLGYCRRVKAIGVGPAAQLIDQIKQIVRGCWRATNTIKKTLGDIVDISPLLIGLETAGHQLHELQKIVGDTIVLPGSISFAKMSEEQMKVFFDKAMVLLETAGHPISDFLQEIERRKKLNPYRGASYGRGQEAQSRDRGIEGEGAEREEAA